MINDILSASVRIATPIALAALGGIFCQRAGVFNIGLEGMMLVGSFAVICGIIASGGNLFIGLIYAVCASIGMSLLFALTVIKFKANQIIAGIAINLLGYGLTSFLLKVLFNATGSLRPEVFEKVGVISIGEAGKVPVLGGLLEGQHFLTYVGIILMFVTALILYKTRFGLSVNMIGGLEEAAATVGINPATVKLKAIIWSGALCGLAGAFLSSVAVSGFTENMVQGRGFTAFTALVFSNANPYVAWLVSLLFGFADALGMRIELSALGFPSSILKMFPYILSIVALMISSYFQGLRIKRGSAKGGRRRTKAAAKL